MKQLTYDEISEYLLSIPKFTGKHTMEDTRAFFEYLGSPCADAAVIHVAGTNGKGSVCTYLRAVLERMGYRTALFISPHLVSIRERFLFDGEMVSEECFCRSFTAVAEALLRYREDCGEPACGGTGDAGESGVTERLRGLPYHPSYFEFLFFMFITMERTRLADYVILETGLGGRLDATNVMPRKKVCVITRIGLDHTEYLGNSVEEIAAEKAGILRRGTPVVCLAQDKRSAGVILACAEKLQAPVAFVEERDFKIERIDGKSIAFSFHSVYYNFMSLRLSTTAIYQAENAALALRAVEQLDLPRRPEAGELYEALLAAHWEARCEEIAPDVYLDGAHNEDGIRALLETVRSVGGSGQNLLVLAIVSDKRYEEMAEMIAQSGLFCRVYATSAGGSRALDAGVLAGLLGKYGQPDCVVCGGPEDAFERSMRERRKGQRIYVAGSLYLAGKIKAHLGRNSDD